MLYRDDGSKKKPSKQAAVEIKKSLTFYSFQEMLKHYAPYYVSPYKMSVEKVHNSHNIHLIFFFKLGDLLSTKKFIKFQYPSSNLFWHTCT